LLVSLKSRNALNATSEAFGLTGGISPFGVDLTISSTLSVASTSFLFFDVLLSLAKRLPSLKVSLNSNSPLVGL